MFAIIFTPRVYCTSIINETVYCRCLFVGQFKHNARSRVGQERNEDWKQSNESLAGAENNGSQL